MLGTHRSPLEQKSRGGYCWRGGERKQDRMRARERTGMASAGLRPSWRCGFSPSSRGLLAFFHGKCGETENLTFPTLVDTDGMRPLFCFLLCFQLRLSSFPECRGVSFPSSSALEAFFSYKAMYEEMVSSTILRGTQ